MKKNILKIPIIAIILAGIIFSCKNELLDLFDDSSVGIVEAQAWYDSNFTSGLTLKSASLEEGRLAKPAWEHAFRRIHADFITVEVPLSIQGRFGIVTEENRQAFYESGDDRYMLSLSRMVVLTEKKSGNTYGFLMTIMPNKGCRESKKFNAFHSTYLKWQKGFSGYVVYNNLDGSFSNGWKIEDGKVTKSVKQGGDTEIGLRLKSATTTCTDYYWVQWYQDCTDYYTLTEWSAGNYTTTFSGTTCDAPYSERDYL
jgi:hypothetical protein